MEDELRLFLLLIGTVFILAVLAHGIWKIRKTNQDTKKARVAPRVVEDDDDDGQYDGKEGFDDLGLGEVRVVSSHSAGSEDKSSKAGEQPDTPYSNAQSNVLDDHNETDADTTGSQKQSNQNTAERPANIIGNDEVITEKNETTASQRPSEPVKEKLYGSVVTNPKPHMASGMSGMRAENGSSYDAVVPFPEPPGFLLKDGETSQDSTTTDNSDSLSEHNIVQSADAVPMRTEPFYHTDTQDDDVPGVSTTQEPEVDDFSLDAPETLQSGAPEKIESASAAGFQEQGKRLAKSKRSKTISRKARQEPNFGDDQMRIDFDESQTDAPVEQPQSSSTTSSQKDKTSDAAQEQEVLVLNVRAKDDEPIAGAALLPMLLTLGFKFGDQDIFHRHVNANGKGPVLFSLANMFKPGVFDIDNLENFTTQGISLFMILPIEGDPHQVFNMMHNAARKLADEFDAQVLDGRRSVLTKQGLQQYVEKIREFERKRMIARS